MMEHEKNLRTRRCAICSAGPVTDAQSLRPLLRKDDFVIAADGGLRLAKSLGLEVGRIIADFDSLPQSQAMCEGVPVSSLPVKKNDTDTMAAARFGIENGFRDFLLLGASGGRLDHTMANFAVMHYLINHNAKVVLADEQNVVRMMLPGNAVIDPVENMHFSLLPYGGSVSGLTVVNAEFELDHAELTPDFPLGVSNEFIGRPVELSFKHGVLMIILSKD